MPLLRGPLMVATIRLLLVDDILHKLLMAKTRGPYVRGWSSSPSPTCGLICSILKALQPYSTNINMSLVRLRTCEDEQLLG